jgi:hypothetical protein
MTNIHLLLLTLLFPLSLAKHLKECGTTHPDTDTLSKVEDKLKSHIHSFTNANKLNLNKSLHFWPHPFTVNTHVHIISEGGKGNFIPLEFMPGLTFYELVKYRK